jgi:hypothetical protein
MSENGIKEWVETCSCNGDCSECEKTPEQCRKDLYKLSKSYYVEQNSIQKNIQNYISEG